MIKIPNAEQKSVIENLTENCILYASAGTGKTFTVANRVSEILSRGLADGREILCLTFTIKACNELMEDIASYAGERAAEVQIHTIHGFCYHLIVEESKRKGLAYAVLSVCDEVDQEEILKSILSSRLFFWRLEKNLPSEQVIPEIENLPLLQTEEGEQVWLYGDFVITTEGEVLPVKEMGNLSPAKVYCPMCEGLQTLNHGTCSVCGKELSLSPPRAEYEIYKRKSALRNFVSEIKHRRQSQGLYSDDVEKDYANAYEYLKREKPDVFSSVTSYHARYLGSLPDEPFVADMGAFVGRFIAEYDERLRASSLLDFDDLILQANEILDGEEGYAYWSEKYKFIILDEMQDTSKLEYTLVKKLFSKCNSMLCGDFFQTIYAWRGSSPEEILSDYASRFQAKVYMLSENYRATKTLANASFGYLRNTYPSLIGKYCPSTLASHSGEEGQPIGCYAYANREKEAWHIYKYLQQHPTKTPAEACVIARTNKYIAELSAYFDAFNEKEKEENRLQFFTVEENFQFFKKPVVKDMLAILKLLVNPLDRVSMERLAQKFVKGVGVKTAELLRGFSQIGLSITSFLEEQTYTHGDAYHRLLEGYRNASIVVYDTETTGLDLAKDEIIQLSAIKIGANGEIVDALDILIEPNVPIAEDAQKTHGFTLEYLRAHGAITAREGLEKFSEFVKGSVLVGHNNFGYDKPLLSRQLSEQSLPPLSIVAEYDTLPLAKQFYPYLPDYKLSTLCERFGVVNRQAHNALGDIEATGKCLVRMIEERILPTALERRAIAAKYAPKFQRFYGFMQELFARLSAGEELGEYIAERLMLDKKYPSHTDRRAVRDVIASLRTEGEDSVAFLKEYLRDASLAGSQMDILMKKFNRIPVITVHQAKGCEFDTVIVAGADDNHFPSFSARGTELEEEEKKVFYVAITRAKKRLILTRALYHGNYTREETPYFWKIPEEYISVNRAWKNGV